MMKQKILAITLVILMISMGVPLDFAVTYKTASVVEVTGVVSILKAGGEQTFTPEVGMTLEHGDRIITGKGASIALEIDADKYIKVGEKTYMSLSELMSEAESGGDSTDIKLFTGKVWASLSKPLEEDDSFEIETPTAVMGAKGTKFFVKYVASASSGQDESSNTELVVLEGKVSMGTQVENKSEGEGPSIVQDVEFIANANETLLLDPELIQGVSSEIESRLNAGETIDQINIQDVVSKVGKAKKIEVKNLDLFVLEIVADDPEEYNRDLTDDLDQLIEQKKQELPEEEGQEERQSNILYGQLSGNDGADSPVTPKLPKDEGDRTDAPSGGETHNNDNETTPLYVTNVKVVDAVLDDGIADHIVITFNQPVKDATYMPSGAQLASEGALGAIDTSEISYGEVPNLEDSRNDATLVFSLDTEGKTVNTSPTGYFSIPNAGMIKATSGVSLGAVSALAITDNIAPVVLGARVSLEGAAQDKYMKLIYSEPIYDLSSNLWDNVRLAATVQIAYSDAQPIGYVTKSHTETYSEANQLDYPTVDYIRAAFEENEGYEEIVLKMNSDAEAYISDESGNKRYLQKDIQLLDFVMDTQNTKVSDVTVQTLTENTDYLFTIKLDDYLSAEQMNTLINSPESFLQGTEIASFTDVSYQYENTDQITINFHVSVLDGALVNNDAITINYTYLYDLFGHSVTDYYDDAVQTMRTYYYHETGDTWTMEALIIPPLHVTNVEVVDAVLDDGIADHMIITFNQPVKDSTYMPSSGAQLASEGALGAIDTSEISYGEVPNIEDSINDATLVFSLNTEGKTVNTSPTGYFSIPNADMIKATSGVSLGGVSERAITDNIAPVVLGARVSLEGTAQEKYIRFIYSEPVDALSSNLWDNVRLAATVQTAYSVAQPVGYETTSQTETYSEAKRLDYSTVDYIRTAFEENEGYEEILLKMNSDAEAYISDESGNQRTLQKDIHLLELAMDEQNTKVSDVTVQTLTENTDYLFTIKLDDYLSSEQMETLINSPESFLQGSFSTEMASITDVTYLFESTDQITINFHVSVFDGALVNNDAVTINYTYLYDLFGYSVTDYYDNAMQTMRTYYYDETGDTWTMEALIIPPTEFYATSVATIDADADGLVDHLQVTFNLPVDDTTFVAENGITLESMGALDPVDDVSIVTDLTGVYTDITDDAVIYLKLDHTQSDIMYNTGSRGTLVIPSGTLKNLENALDNQAVNMVTDDHAAPVMIGGTYAFDGTRDEKVISLITSEPLSPSSFNTLDFRMLNNNTSLFADAYPVEYAQMVLNQGSKGNETRLFGLSYDTLKPMIAFENDQQTIYLYFNDDMKIADDSGNQTALMGEKIDVIGSTLDTDKTLATEVELVDLGSSNQYRISLTFNDYLDRDIVDEYFAGLEDAVIFIGADNHMTITDHAYNASLPGDVTLSFDFQMIGPLLTTDQFSIDVELLFDYAMEQIYVTNEGIDRTKFKLIYSDSNWTFDSPYLSLLEANTVDYDHNGKIDFIQLIFNEPVNDANFIDVGAVVNSNLILPNDVETSKLAFPGGLDFLDDTTIYFAVSEGDTANTGAEGTLDIPSSGMIQTSYGRVLPATNGVQINDGAGPVYLDSEIDLSLPYDEKYISLTFSEPLNESDAVAIEKLKLMSLSGYANGPIDLEGTTEVLGNKIFIRPLELGSVDDGAPSFISKLSNYLYGQGITASIRLDSDLAISSDHDESYVLPDGYTYPYDGPESSSIQRINAISNATSVETTTVTTGSSVIIVTYTDYLESFNHLSGAFIPSMPEVKDVQGCGDCVDLGIIAQAIAIDHKSLEFVIMGDPITGDNIMIRNVRNITNSYGDESNEIPIYAGDTLIRFDGINWEIAPY